MTLQNILRVSLWLLAVLMAVLLYAQGGAPNAYEAKVSQFGWVLRYGMHAAFFALAAWISVSDFITKSVTILQAILPLVLVLTLFAIAPESNIPITISQFHQGIPAWLALEWGMVSTTTAEASSLSVVFDALAVLALLLMVVPHWDYLWNAMAQYSAKRCVRYFRAHFRSLWRAFHWPIVGVLGAVLLVYIWGGSHWLSFRSALWSAVFCGGFLWLLGSCMTLYLRQQALGSSDPILFAAIGAMVGAQGAFLSLIAMLGTGFLCALGFRIVKGEPTSPLLPSLCMGAIFIIFT
ncbi:MAG: hypothetical protein KDD62_15700, partial [Bdellovibrionales bacterium]|nr:hypothetical protein [Bdellovibrionales bacterium]